MTSVSEPTFINQDPLLDHLCLGCCADMSVSDDRPNFVQQPDVDRIVGVSNVPDGMQLESATIDGQGLGDDVEAMCVVPGDAAGQGNYEI